MIINFGPWNHQCLLTRGTREPQIHGKDDQLSTMGSWGSLKPTPSITGCPAGRACRAASSILGLPSGEVACPSHRGHSTPSPGMENRWTMMNIRNIIMNMSQNHQSKLIKLLWMFFSLISDQIHSWSAWVYCCHGDVPCNKGCVMFCGQTELSTGPLGRAASLMKLGYRWCNLRPRSGPSLRWLQRPARNASVNRKCPQFLTCWWVTIGDPKCRY
jgi:hypothetical protein